MTTAHCESCSMPIETGRYCQYCTTDDGRLQDFSTRLAKIVAWQRQSHPEQSPSQARAATLQFMSSMPAWRDHPEVIAATR